MVIITLIEKIRGFTIIEDARMARFAAIPRTLHPISEEWHGITSRPVDAVSTLGHTYLLGGIIVIACIKHIQTIVSLND